jgi:hypothetical protein
LKFFNYLLLLGSCHSEAKIGNDKFGDIGLGEEATLVHASSQEVESRPTHEGVIYIEEGGSL